MSRILLPGLLAIGITVGVAHAGGSAGVGHSGGMSHSAYGLAPSARSIPGNPSVGKAVLQGSSLGFGATASSLSENVSGESPPPIGVPISVPGTQQAPPTTKSFTNTSGSRAGASNLSVEQCKSTSEQKPNAIRCD